MRCFVAIPVPARVREQVAAIQGEAKAACQDVDVRWTGAASLHLTLRFLGNVAAPGIDALGQALAGAVAQYRVLRLSLGGVGAFPSLRRARVVWLGLTEGGTALVDLADAIGRVLGPLGFEAEPRPFTPHLTLGRIRTPQRGADLRVALDPFARVQAGSWSPSAAVLYESRLVPTGAVHEVRAEYPLG